MRKKTEDYTIKELLEMGAKVDVYFFGNGNLQNAYDKVKPFTDLSSIEKNQSDNAVWVKVKSEHIDVTSFL